MSHLPSLVDTEGGRNVLYLGQWLYPQSNPTRAAEQRSEALAFQESCLLVVESPVLCFGLDKLDPRWHEHCFAIECDPMLAALSNVPNWLPLVVAQDTASLVKKLREFLDRSLYRRLVFLSLSGGRRLFQNKYIEIENLFNEDLRQYWRNRSTLRFHIRRWTRNIVENMAIHFDTIKSIETQKPVLVVGAGPSLDAQIDWIRKSQDGLCIICADTALRPLLTNGIEPDFVVLLEGQWFTLEDFPKQLPSKTVLIADWTAHAPTLRYLSKSGAKISLIATLFYDSATLKRLIDASGLLQVPALGSVGVLALYLSASLTQQACCAVVGLDFKNQAMKSHAIHSPRHDGYLNRNTKTTGLVASAHAFEGTDSVLESYASLAQEVIGAFDKNWTDLRGDLGLDLGLNKDKGLEFAKPDSWTDKEARAVFEKSSGRELLAQIKRSLEDRSNSDKSLVNLFCMDFNFDSEVHEDFKVQIRLKELIDLISRHLRS